MRTTHAFGVPLVIFLSYLSLTYVFSSNPTISSFLVDNVKSINWWCTGFFLGINFDFLRRATHSANYIQVNSVFFLWVITVALLFQLFLAAGQGIILMNGTAQLTSLLSGHEGIILVFIIGTAAVNALGYAIGVDRRTT
jgi:hypothetical protein